MPTPVPGVDTCLSLQFPVQSNVVHKLVFACCSRQHRGESWDGAREQGNVCHFFTSVSWQETDDGYVSMTAS